MVWGPVTLGTHDAAAAFIQQKLQVDAPLLQGSRQGLGPQADGLLVVTEREVGRALEGLAMGQ